MKIVFRPLKFAFYKNWYSLQRYYTPTEYEGKRFKAIDVGFFSIIFKSVYIHKETKYYHEY